MDSLQYTSPEVTDLAKALIAVQHTLQPAIKDRENPFAKSRYATLNSVMDSCRDALLANGIWVAQYPVPAETGHLGLVTKLTHAESGQWQSSLLVMPLPKTDPQGYGSAMTYARRYSLSAMLGLVTEDDDDGEAASRDRPARQRTPRQPRPQQPAAAPAQQPPQPPTTQQPKPAETAHPALASLPRLDGVSYTTATAQDGRLCILASGSTSARKQLLSAAGFKWNAERKVWWRYAETA
ncbi:single-stranded DNA-binding protein [Desulfovibrio oxamicus]|uniref:Single-stranded DNA-binding protein n=1 Tax=Nitratidesulfovibrio oxamicus TaxID=32016 RepID=A0ABS0J359_9BACT|nr:ERF family protein [Nitratidesulfovibrio oxamicus]MBG3876406.1 single-stranded DNA-binding protein [Nitratidesulfovibrio oxamicus]